MDSRIATRPVLSRACVVALAIASSVVALLQSQAQGPEIPKGANTLFGRVLDEGSEAPLAGAVVTLTGFFDSSGRASAAMPQSLQDPDVSTPRRVMTNGDGYYFFRDLPAGRYSLAASAFGYVNNVPLRVVELTNSEKPAAVPVYLWKYAAISGTVLDERGEPVAGVPVTALQRVTTGGGMGLRDVEGAPTDDRGIYRIAKLPPGVYVVGVLSSTMTLPASLAAEVGAAATDQSASTALSRELIPGGSRTPSSEGLRSGNSVLQEPGPLPLVIPDGRMLSYATTFSPGTPITADATVIRVASGEERTAVDVPLRLSPTVRVSGAVTGPDGPIRNLAVRLLPPNAADTTALDPLGAATALSDAHGAFTFLAVTPGSYTLTASFVPPPVPSGSAVGVALWAAQPLTIAESDLTGLVVSMQSGIRVSGRVEFKSATGSPASDARECVLGFRPLGAHAWRSAPTWSAADGTFATAGESPGRYIAFAISRVPGWTLQTISRGGSLLADDVIDLKADDVSDLVLTFSDKASRVSGSVVDARGAADPQADVIVFPADTTLWREGVFNDRRVRLMPATSIAAFEFTGLAPGAYYIAAIDAHLTSDWQDPAFLDRLIAGATKFAIGEAEEKSLPLRTFTPREP